MKTLPTLLLLGVLLITGCTVRIDPSSKMSEFKEIKILEEGIISGDRYVMFRDPRTGVRIFYYYNAMVVLPSEKAEK